MNGVDAITYGCWLFAVGVLMTHSVELVSGGTAAAIIAMMGVNMVGLQQ